MIHFIALVSIVYAFWGAVAGHTPALVIAVLVVAYYFTCFEKSNLNEHPR